MKLRSSKLLLLAFVFTLGSLAANIAAAQDPKRVEITAKRWEYTPNEITLKKGQPAVIVIKALDADHGLKFEDLKLSTKISKGSSSELPFTPDKAGDFTGQCSVFCGSGHGGMKLTIHVTE